jgi:hypothetical protein
MGIEKHRELSNRTKSFALRIIGCRMLFLGLAREMSSVTRFQDQPRVWPQIIVRLDVPVPRPSL